MRYFDFTWQGFTFEMVLTPSDNAEESHWTDVEFASDIGSVGESDSAYIEVDQLTETVKDEIREQAYNYLIENFAEQEPDDIDRECAEYHARKEDW